MQIKEMKKKILYYKRKMEKKNKLIERKKFVFIYEGKKYRRRRGNF